MDATWIGVLIAGCTVVFGFAGWALLLTFNAGRHAQRLDTTENDIKAIKTTVEDHVKAISAWDMALGLLHEMRQDLKNVQSDLAALGRPPRRGKLPGEG